MLRISKLTDYGIVMMAFLAKSADTAFTAKDIAQQTHIALPTVSKLLKLLAKNKLLFAQRGAKGGYRLACAAKQITLAQIIFALEGNIALTECGHHPNICAMETSCAIRSNWRMISDVIRAALSGITLAEMVQPLSKKHIQNHVVKFLAVAKSNTGVGLNIKAEVDHG